MEHNTAPQAGPGSQHDGGIAIRDLELAIVTKTSRIELLRGLSLDAPQGQITGLAGESGSGKTMTGLTICGLEPTKAKSEGQVWYRGRNLLELSRKQMNKHRGCDIAMIFQDPVASLHPMLSIKRQMTDHMRFHLGLSRREAIERAAELLDRVAVPDPRLALEKFPHQFSGGQLQRIAIASALAANPSVLIADEPTTALDVTVQAGILALLRKLCDELEIAIILVTHDLGVMSSIADTVAIMRDGRIVEHGDRYQVIRDPAHHYTRELVEALPQHRPPLTGITEYRGQNS
ncbi:MAG: ABC transporter ATP-binding protein [Actinomycetaceae bacterium]|nr:ABC transporter ATP-binding protein [Actinomycetaceae bacterium]